MTMLSTSSIELAPLMAAVTHPSAGAVATFVGVVRDHNEGRAVTRLEYHAYDSMAEKEMAAIVQQITLAHEGVRIAATHRLGSLAVGDIAVACAASAPHRAEAFAACRALIDEIKARVPIWKREHGPDGPHWVGWADARCGADHAHDEHAHGQSEA
jgi:YD repeat-containing protein